MKRAPISILIITVITGIICIFGMRLLSGELAHMSQMHNQITEEFEQKRENMTQMSMLLSDHHAMVNNFVLTDEAEVRAEYERQENELRGRIKERIVSLNKVMKGGKREQIYHLVYSNFCSYLNNVETMMEYSRNGDKNMAVYYNDHVLMAFMDKINANVDALNELTLNDIETVEKKIQDCITFSRILRRSCIIVVIIMMIVCIISCVRIASKLDNVRENLEEELIEKNKKLQAHIDQTLRLQDNIIYAISNLIENRDLETGEHVKRTSDYVRMLAERAKEKDVYADILSDGYIEHLVKAAPLHDIGKIAVPDRILLKPGKLTEEEFEEIKKHAPKGGEIVNEIFFESDDKEYVKLASDVAAYHHEKWDGKGYPAGLSGEDIPLSARIMALADVFDALISKRHYKEAFELDKAFGIIKESAGSHFDPKLAEIFLELRPIIERYLEDAE